mmetsp:Transcript_1768/g.1558  ORF Transcript_1768/g.1558 Transcript_1768/m.1558 type:complete len:95 (+) Transcript_1768:1463-1747(+)
MINPLFHHKLQYCSKPLKKKAKLDNLKGHQKSFSKNYIVEHIDHEMSLSSKIIPREVNGEDLKISKKRIKKKDDNKIKQNRSNQCVKNNFLQAK